jgi:surface antigen
MPKENPTMAPRSVIRHSCRAPAVAGACLGLFVMFCVSGLVADEFENLSVIVPAVNDALETRRTGTSVPWSNPATGEAGTISILRTYYRADSVPCREYERTTERPGSDATVVHGVGCRVGPSFWQLEEDVGTEPEPPTRAVEVEPAPESAPTAEEESTPAMEEAPADEIVIAATAPEPEPEPDPEPAAIEEPVIIIGAIPIRSDE